MKYYFDITLNPSKEIRLNVLLNEVYTKLHESLFDLKASDIGVSFPRFNVLLGNIIRVHSSKEKLILLQSSNWLDILSKYCKVSEVLKVPDQKQYRIVSRKQSNMTNAKLKRLIKRATIKQEDIKKYKIKMLQNGLSNPYLELKSKSNGQKHRRYIQFSKLMDNNIDGDFDYFGLSKTATIPWF